MVDLSVGARSIAPVKSDGQTSGSEVKTLVANLLARRQPIASGGAIEPLGVRPLDRSAGGEAHTVEHPGFLAKFCRQFRLQPERLPETFARLAGMSLPEQSITQQRPGAAHPPR